MSDILDKPHHDHGHHAVEERRPVNIEESDIFPRARQCLERSEIAAIETEYAALKDPVFGAQVDDYFARLHEAIVGQAWRFSTFCRSARG